MFRYLWRHKAVSVALLCLFGIGLYLQPVAAWFGLGLLLFLRLTKVHSLVLIFDLTDRAAMKHVRILAMKRAHMLSPDEYGNRSEDTWDKHLNTFIKRMSPAGIPAQEGLCASSSAKRGGRAGWLSGFAKSGFLVLLQVVHVEIAMRLKPVLMRFHRQRPHQPAA